MRNQIAIVALAASLGAAAPAFAQPFGPRVVVTGPRVFAPVRVRVAPPALRVEVRPPAPSPRHFWVPGHWYWQGGRHVWIGGYWEAPRDGQEWVPGRWVTEGAEWVWQPGHWQTVVAPQPEVVVEAAPPPPQVEVRPMAPSAAHVWIGGHWYWNGGRYAWQPGHWEMRREGMTWEPAHWVPQGNHWRFVAGHWR